MRKLLLLFALLLPSALFAQEEHNTTTVYYIGTNKGKEYRAQKANDESNLTRTTTMYGLADAPDSQMRNTTVTYIGEADVWNSDHRHNIRIGIGLPGLYPINALERPLKEATEFTGDSMSDNLASYRYYWEDIQYTSFYALEYSYDAAEWVSVGVKLSALSLYRHRLHHQTLEKIESRHNTTLSAVLCARFTYLNRQYVQLYSGLGLGVRTNFGVSHETSVAYDVTWFGLSVGARVYGLFELGSGYSGTLRAGIGFRF